MTTTAQTIHSESSVFDKVTEAFKRMRKHGIIARQNFSCCTGCACSELATLLDARPKKIGGVFYHRQDNAAFENFKDLYLGFGCNAHQHKDDPAGESEATIKVGQLAVACLKECFLDVVWDGTSTTKIMVRVSPPRGYRSSRYY